MAILQYVRGVVSRFYRATMDSTKEFIIRVLMGVLIFLGYVLLSLFIYAILRRIMVPQKLHVKPVHLYYDPACQVDSSPSCPFPRAEFLLYGGKKLLSSGQYYKVAVELELPESQTNVDIGVFMVNITFYTTGGRYLSSSARPAMLHYRSPLLNTMYTFVYALPLLTGLWEQKQTMDLVLYESYYEPYGDGSLSVVVSFLHHKIQLYSTILTIDANFSGFTYYLYQWPMSMSVIVVSSIFITLCTCTIIMWVRDVMRDYELTRRRQIAERNRDRQQREILRRQQEQRERQRQMQQRAATVRGPPAGGPADDGMATPSEASVDTIAGVEELSISPGSATPTESVTETASELSDNFNAVLGSLQTLRREIDGEQEGQGGRGTATETSSTVGSEVADGEDRSEGLRRRTGQ